MMRSVARVLGRLVLAWLMLLIAVSVVSDVITFAKNRLPRVDDRAELPNYPDPELARAMFSDAKQTVEEYAPYVAWTRAPLSTEHVNINEDGHRVHSAGRDDSPGSRTIGFFGGSTTWGTGVSDDDTVPARFDQLTTGFTVTNYAQGSHTTRQNLAKLVNLVDTGRMPDVVVFYGGHNHVRIHCDRAITDRLNSHKFERPLARKFTEQPRYGYVFEHLVMPVRDFYDRIAGNRFGKPDRICRSDPAHGREVAATLVRMWEAAHAMVTGLGGEFHAFLQPVAYYGSPRIDHIEGDLRGPEEAAQFDAVFSGVQAILAARDLDYVTDLSGAFDGDEYILLDSAHASAAGSDIIAAAMVEKIVR